jgi:hypothetical protein
MRNICAATACVLLLNATLAVPFLVECISVDGRGLIETLGQDPCHTIRTTTVPVSAGPCLCTDIDPCDDFLLDAPTVVENFARVLPVPPRWTGEAPDLSRWVVAMRCSDSQIPCSVEQLIGPMPEPPPSLPLRI